MQCLLKATSAQAMQNKKQLANYMSLSLIFTEIKLPFRPCHENRGSRCSFVLQTGNNKDIYFLEVPFSIPVTLLNSIAICVIYFRINISGKKIACLNPPQCQRRKGAGF